ncbi:hypothetical protein CAPTEDRAFT_221903 [Capitella teleta]|uniref:G-protein coupled receptors family 1 profile domain-containing protein n=1 Tax=Capitella teleta TaxID=283909 RepID=R7T3D3_CAPTE|nr:hypothetical protein CAPTEDRAFT_221903 [Capitella teleta]|eukprot:ELT87227.1 hypothetical protein CAPTEDRAFT_221903 [Capitella teleta]
MTVGTESYTTAKDKAAVLNQSFIAPSRPRFLSLDKRTDSTLAYILFSEYRVKKIMQNLNVNKASACSYEAFVVFYCGCASIWTLTALSFFRYIKICSNTQASKMILAGQLFNKTRVLQSLAPINLITLIWCVAPLLGWGSYGPEAHGVSCSLDWAKLSASYISTIFVFSYLLPACVITFSYVRIGSVVRRSRLAIQGRGARKDIYSYKVSVVMCSTFMLSWLPYALLSFLRTLPINLYIQPDVTVIATVLAKSNTFVNPAIYFLAVKRFREDALFVFTKQNPVFALIGRGSFGTDQTNRSSIYRRSPVVLEDTLV